MTEYLLVRIVTSNLSNLLSFYNADVYIDETKIVCIQGDQIERFFANWGECLCTLMGFRLKIAEVAQKIALLFSTVEIMY
jgi:hypothetical protein